ncbi:glycosyltransferase family 9 protein [Roseomonas sp. AR75]|uniref:glycosyltransferase family 9 protein n=1 Tax=Roseomonas sp. AR75 TaxID=2562311 RepID=UPI0010BFB9DB|nr:glycosyltransferase family 9 protein [Roseomonas sp. AR75]
MSPPEDREACWMALMRRGDWAAAWRLSDETVGARRGQRDWTAPRHLQPVWDGTPLEGRRVLVRCYHGLGDTIQFARLLAPLQRIAAKVTVWAQPALIPLLATLRPAPHLLPLHDGTPEAEYDTDIEIMELAHALRLTPSDLAGKVPYLHPPARPRSSDRRLQVGLAWRAGEWDARRSVPIDLLRPLGAMHGIALHILQRGPALTQRPTDFGVESGCDDVFQAASRMRALDLVVSVDSMPAHLAGALGVPVWLLLPQPADWRWMDGREDSPWYPGMRLFRQERAGDWSAPVLRLLSALQRAPRSPSIRGAS